MSWCSEGEADLADLAPGGRVHYAGGAQTGGRLQRPDERLGDRAEVSALWLNPELLLEEEHRCAPVTDLQRHRSQGLFAGALAARFLAFFAAFLAARFWAFLAAFLDFFEVTSSSSEAHVSGPTTPVLGIACFALVLLTAFRVAGPKYPERGVTLSTFWTRFTAECCMPEVRIGWVSARAGAVRCQQGRRSPRRQWPCASFAASQSHSVASVVRSLKSSDTLVISRNV